MTTIGKQLSNPYTTGGGGFIFETHVQASFVVLMLTGGFVPCLPLWPIKKIKLQGKYKGYDIDDLIVFIERTDSSQERKLLAQIKHSIKITKNNKIFEEVIQAAWNDFNNPNVFTKGRDKIALITGPLSGIDTFDVRTILEWARNSDSSDDFIDKVTLRKFSSNSKREKLEAFQLQLKKANGGKEVSDEELFQFLKDFHLLGYDLDIKAGVTLSLLHSLIGKSSQEDAHALWTQLIVEVQSVNQNAGTITINSLPEKLRSAFKKQIVEIIPADFVKTHPTPSDVDWNQTQFPSELAIANFLGSWNEKSGADKEIVEKLANDNYTNWIAKIREILQQPESPVALKNGIWTVTKRNELWQALGERLFDSHLDILKKCAVEVLTERDPKFDLIPEERYAASIHGKVLKHSDELRNGITEGLALLGSYPNALSNCSLDRPTTIAVLTVREILGSLDWVLWGSLNRLLPLLAEAAPGEFLSAVESALEQESSPFDTLFSQEGDAITGENYLAGLLWALETLAWDEQYLVRVTVILGELASHDPGGTWANRPANSLATIFLPWFPQTTATIEKRKVAVQTLQKEFPDVAWKLLLTLGPNTLQSSSGSHKPICRKIIPEERSEKVSSQEYWDQVSNYSEMMVEMAKGHIAKLNELLRYIGILPQPSFDKILEHLRSRDVTGMEEDERIPLWTELQKLVSKHKRFADAEWALSPDLVVKIENIMKSLAPQNPLNLHRKLFSGRDYELYEEIGDHQEQQKKLEDRRQQALRDILGFGEIEAVFQFAKTVESPWNVGLSLEFIVEADADPVILPSLLESESKKLEEFANGFIWGRYQSQGWQWVDNVGIEKWSQSQIGQFLVFLPFTEETWSRSNKFLGGDDGAYWRKANVNPYYSPSELDLAIDKLLEYERPNAAIICLYKILNDKKPLDQKRVVKALLSAISSKEPVYSLEVYHIEKIIKALQDDPATNSDDLFQVEWAYLPLLNKVEGTTPPKLLEQRLAADPKIFCEMIGLLYRSEKETETVVESTPQQKSIATNVWTLLRNWGTPPGTQPDGSFSDENFKEWMKAVRKECSNTGHLEVALSHIGNMLIHSPPDSDGLWINRTIAEALNDKDAQKMRIGFRTGIFNLRGMHWVDPTGKPEKELAEEYRKKAEEVENAGYQRLAVTLKGLAESYELDAKRIVDEHRGESAE